MRTTWFWRVGLLVALAPCAAVATTDCEERRQRDEAARAVDELYEGLERTRGPEYVERWFGRPGWRVTVGRWPKRLGDLPDYPGGLPHRLPVDVYRRVVVVREPVTPDWGIEWRVWRVPGPHRWIAVGFAVAPSGEYAIYRPVAKRSGRSERTPPGLFD